MSVSQASQAVIGRRKEIEGKAAAAGFAAQGAFALAARPVANVKPSSRDS
ncbi:MAG: hypothetical protein LBU32_28100 [Clostridiales bacterium]|nr:hypothetical protein [Clostridiales bacterium]